jgi:DNA-binding transcriptional LysR family regulator
MSGLELRQLRALLAVVDHGGYVRAAEALGVSQSTVSESLAALERAAGTPLLRRTNRLLATTPAGERLLPLARRMLALHDEMLAAVALPGEGAVVTIGANESVATYLLPRHLATLRERANGAHFQIVTGSCAEIREKVRSGKLDLGLVLEPAQPEAPRLITTKLLVLASPLHPLASRSASALQLSRQTFCLSDVAGSFHTLLHRYFRAAGFPAPEMEAAGSVEAVKRTVISGEYLGVLPAFAVADELASRTIAAVTADPPIPPIVLASVQPAKGEPAPAARELLELLRSTAAPAGR